MIAKVYSRLACVAVVLALSGCGAGIDLDKSSTAVRVAGTLPQPDSTVLAIDPASYRLGPTDVITVSVFGASELDSESAIDAGGNFSMPLIGTIAAAGKTPEQLSKEIEDRLRANYVKHPNVTVNVKDALAHRVTIDGAVKTAGVYPVVGGMTLQQAIALAKGPSDIASIKKVIVFRTVEGQHMAAMFNLLDIRSGRYPDPEIYGNDIVIVGENATRRFLRDTAILFPLVARFTPVP